MKGERNKRIVAGAPDYITRPLDTRRLLALLRTWLRR
jgi:DNA-binding response OmpR family regulator